MRRTAEVSHPPLLFIDDIPFGLVLTQTVYLSSSVFIKCVKAPFAHLSQRTKVNRTFKIITLLL